MNISLTNSSSVAALNAQITSIYTASYTINLILGLPTNVYVLWLILIGAGGTMASEFFSLNLAVSEVLYCLFSVFALVHRHVPKTALAYLGAFSLGFLNTGRPLFQCCICVERYLAVVHPVVFLKYKALRYRAVCCSVVWLMVLGSCFLRMFDNFSPVSHYSVLGQSLIYFLLMSFCCLSVLWALKRPGPGDGDREGTHSIKMKAFKIILIFLVYATLSQLPIVLVISTKIYIPYVDFFSAMSICFCIIVISGFVQPLLYLHRVGKLGKLPFMRGLRQIDKISLTHQCFKK